MACPVTCWGQVRGSHAPLNLLLFMPRHTFVVVVMVQRIKTVWCPSVCPTGSARGSNKGAAAGDAHRRLHMTCRPRKFRSQYQEVQCNSVLYYNFIIENAIIILSWWRSTVVERRSLAGELSLSCARPAADG